MTHRDRKLRFKTVQGPRTGPEIPDHDDSDTDELVWLVKDFRVCHALPKPVLVVAGGTYEDPHR